jgi:hypothetical protein
MKRWHSLSLGDAVTAHVPLTRIREAFEVEFPAGARAADVAVFVRYESEGRLHCEATAFLSPQAGELARRLGAHACAAPVREGLELLAGGEGCWDAIFAAEQRRS